MDSKFDNSQFFFLLLILQPTRVTKKSKTLIDNIFFNNFEFNAISGNVIHSKSDHLIQFGTLKDFLKPLCKSSIYKPNFKIFDRNKLKEDF